MTMSSNSKQWLWSPMGSRRAQSLKPWASARICSTNGSEPPGTANRTPNLRLSIFAAWRPNNENEANIAIEALLAGDLKVTDVLLGDETYGGGLSLIYTKRPVDGASHRSNCLKNDGC